MSARRLLIATVTSSITIFDAVYANDPLDHLKTLKSLTAEESRIGIQIKDVEKQIEILKKKARSLKRAGSDIDEQRIKVKADHPFRAGGVVPWARRNGELLVLMGKETRELTGEETKKEEAWYFFVGGRDNGESAYSTASRECCEETLGRTKVDDVRAKLVRENAFTYDAKDGRRYIFVVNIEFVSPLILRGAIEKEDRKPCKRDVRYKIEKEDYCWVRYSDLKAAVNKTPSHNLLELEVLKNEKFEVVKGWRISKSARTDIKESAHLFEKL